jgi:hypothetical protein
LVEEDLQKLDFKLWARIAETGFWAFGGWGLGILELWVKWRW